MMTGPWLISYVLLWVLFLAMAVVLISTLRNLGVMYSMISGGATASATQPQTSLTQGATLPDATWFTAHGEPKSAHEFSGEKMAFAVISPGCDGCAIAIERILKEGPDPLDESLRDFVLVSLGDPAHTAAMTEKFNIPGDVPTFLDRDSEIRRKWGVTATPFTVIVDQDMRVVRQVFAAGMVATPNGHRQATEPARS
jgi:hypothetical protein